MNTHLLPLAAAAVLSGAMLGAAAWWMWRKWPMCSGRIRWLLAAPLGPTALVWLLFVYAFLIEPETLVVRRVEIVSAHWHGAPLTIAAIGDTHVGGPHVDAARMGRVVQRINALHSDLVVLLGDYVAGHLPETRRSPEENQDIVKAFLTRHPEFTVDNAGASVSRDLVNAEGFVETFPHRHAMDGSFAARLVKSSDHEPSRSLPP